MPAHFHLCSPVNTEWLFSWIAITLDIFLEIGEDIENHNWQAIIAGLTRFCEDGDEDIGWHTRWESCDAMRPFTRDNVDFHDSEIGDYCLHLPWRKPEQYVFRLCYSEPFAMLRPNATAHSYIHHYQPYRVLEWAKVIVPIVWHLGLTMDHLDAAVFHFSDETCDTVRPLKGAIADCSNREIHLHFLIKPVLYRRVYERRWQGFCQCHLSVYEGKPNSPAELLGTHDIYVPLDTRLPLLPNAVRPGVSSCL
ncbi:hypothetical protein B0A50_02897 [Salinomyces thailandicus]|uniref:Uncharacterized protein n=1 Tax=Salinomyces thailandicus TaxID=706561 RepID=A0A4U0U599_9PEZI|nr:hypothetical protein B0A50_02897 [Salinomyces thailandica]